MSAGELNEVLSGLKARGCVTIGLRDVLEFYEKGVRLPPNSVLLAFTDNSPRGLDLADGVIGALRQRAAAFISKTADSEDIEERKFLTPHAVKQMRLGGAWEFGLISQNAPPTIAAAGRIRALLNDDGRRPPPSRFETFPLLFNASDLGLNDESDDPRALRVLALRPDRSARENIAIVMNSWPRSAEFADDFQKEGLGADWMSGWGVVSMGGRRLVLLPTPRQSGAGVFLRGTEKWRDVTLHFTLRRYQKEFWAYTRYKEEGEFLRVGARGGYWYVEQKTGPNDLPRLLARAAILPGGFPARVRLVLKGGRAIVHVNGRMQFGRPLAVSAQVDRGRVMFGVYDPRARAALAEVASVRAAPLGERWISPTPEFLAEVESRPLDGLREEAVSARAISPRWIAVANSGKVTAVSTQEALLRSMAGFYGCRLIPMAEFPNGGASILSDAGSARRLALGLADAARSLDVPGVNLRLRRGDASRDGFRAALAEIHEVLKEGGRELWITLDAGAPADPRLASAVDGVLRASGTVRGGIENLDGEALTATLTAARLRRGSSTIQ
jgi:hypothetical protein